MYSSCESQQISLSITAYPPFFPNSLIHFSTLVCPTASTTTTLAACDHTLGDNPDLLNCMCVLAIARGDGTLFDANSHSGGRHS